MVVGRVVGRVGLLLLRLETAMALRLATVLMTAHLLLTVLMTAGLLLTVPMTAGLLLTSLLSAERSVYSSSY